VVHVHGSFAAHYRHADATQYYTHHGRCHYSTISQQIKYPNDAIFL
jgi:hypothetical protein